MARTADIDRVIHIVEIVLAIGRSIVLATSIFGGINVAIAAYNFATGNMAWAIFHLLLTIAGIVMLAQIRQTRRRHRSRKAKLKQMPEKYHEVASA
ncbi:MAG TPA: hypothetical protein VGQ13_00880 [Nitrososphaera sp.]|nr:hypothetical protein [Nitrososphaera sp.]